MTEPLVYALTVNWNRPADTLECLRSLACQTYPNMRLLVVDNASDDNSVELISREFPEAELILNQENLGFAGGYNTGIRKALQSGAGFVFIINNDAYLAPDAIAAMMQYVDEKQGILAPVVYYAASPDIIWAVGGPTNRWTLEKRDAWANKPDPERWPEVLQVDFVTGCGMLISAKAAEEVGLFDEGFHMYYEDSDLCYRMRAADFRIGVVPQAKMWHKVASSSGGSNSPNERYWMAKSSIRFFRKHARWPQKAAVLLWRTGSAMHTTARLLFQWRITALAAYWKGILDGLKTPLPTENQ